MPWCPICKNEYVRGVKECSDCHRELVEALGESCGEPITFGEEEEIQKIKAFLEYSLIRSARAVFDEADGVYELFVDKSEEKAAKKAVSIYRQEEENQKKTEDKEQGKKTVSYEKQSEKAEDYKSSAYSLIGVGVLGAAVLLLIASGILPFHVSMMTYAVMGIFFTLLIVTGILSYRSYQKSAEKAVAENHLSEELKEWCAANLTEENIEKGLLLGEELKEEMKYYSRIDRMKQLITEAYPDLEEGFLDAAADEIYTEIFDHHPEA